MAIVERIVGWDTAKVSKRLASTLPWIGAAVALVTIGASMRRKGIVRGGVDSALNAIPLVGTVKNVAEVVRGRDFIPDREVSSLPRRA